MKREGYTGGLAVFRKPSVRASAIQPDDLPCSILAIFSRQPWASMAASRIRPQVGTVGKGDTTPLYRPTTR
ncbi:MAG TPA: hypothetical protein PLM79_06620 [Syntrophobacteraceae bacterium]|nr:hypothetical protein [Syntrophobacteraceae bacterium]